MKKYLLCIAALAIVSLSFSQDFKGQWKGVFVDKSTSFVGFGNDRCEYVLELEVEGRNVTGYSYTYFTDGGKKYYTICALKGFVDRAKKYMEVKEYVRTKTNVPDNIRNCFQVHKLSYSKTNEAETLAGNWIPASNQEGDCGFGTTSLERRVLKRDYALYNNKAIIKKAPVTAKTTKKPVPSSPKKTTSPVVKQPKKTDPPVVKSNKDVVQEVIEKPVAKIKPKVMQVPVEFEKRNNTVLKTIEVENSSVKVDLYDNGEIDGDSISLFYNGELLLSHKKLSDKPISLNVNVDKDNLHNELVMYAENLGTIPPNTALMVVMDGNKRYEIRITSDLQKSGTIWFALKPGDSGK